MVLKLFKAAWFVSVVAVFANLLYVYASLPEQVIIQQESTGQTAASRELLFYLMTALILFLNALVYINSTLNPEKVEFRSWFHGQMLTINVFLIFAMSLVQVYNSAEVFNFGKVGFSIYGSVGLVIVWAAVWPLYALFKKIYPKQIVS